MLAWVMIQIQMVGGDLAVGDEKYFELGFGRNTFPGIDVRGNTTLIISVVCSTRTGSLSNVRVNNYI